MAFLLIIILFFVKSVERNFRFLKKLREIRKIR